MRIPGLIVLLLPALLAGPTPAQAGGRDVPSERGDGRELPAGEDPVLDAWIALLVTRLDDAHDAIRRSAGSALVALGEPALGALRRRAEGEGKGAGLARNLARDIERRSRSAKRGPWSHDDEGPERFRRALVEAGFAPEQVQAIEDAVKKRHQRTREVFRQLQDGEISHDERGEAMRRVNEDVDRALEEALGEEAMARYRELMKKLRSRGRRPGPGDG